MYQLVGHQPASGGDGGPHGQIIHKHRSQYEGEDPGEGGGKDGAVDQGQRGDDAGGGHDERGVVSGPVVLGLLVVTTLPVPV